jgi:hypothetical protein
VIADAWTECAGDAAKFDAEMVIVFGNGSQSKKTVAEGGDKIPGTLAEFLSAGKVTVGPVRKFLSDVRKVAQGYSKREDVRKSETLGGALKLVKPAKAETATVDAGTTKDVGDIEMMGRLLERNGGAACLGMIESYLASKADTIRAGYVHEARTKFGKTA